MDARDRPRHRCVQIKKEGAEEPLSPPHRKNVWWQIKELPCCSTRFHFTSSSVNSLCGTSWDWPPNRQPSYHIVNKTKKQVEAVWRCSCYSVLFVLLFIRHFSILIVKDLHSHWNNLLHSYWSLMAPSLLYCSPIVSCKLLSLHFFPRPHWIHHCWRGWRMDVSVPSVCSLTFCCTNG